MNTLSRTVCLRGDRLEPATPRGSRVALTALLVLVLGTGSAAAEAPPAHAAGLLAGRALGETPLMEDLRALCDGIGGRITGSASCERAIDWGVETFRAAGLPKVWTEEFTVPVLWLPGTVSVTALDPERFKVDAVAAPFSANTPPTKGRLIVAGTGRPEDFKALGEGSRGGVALVKTGILDSFQGLFAEYMRDRAMLTAAKEAGLSAILIVSTRPRELLYRHPVSIGGDMAPLPVAVVSREDALRLERLLEGGPVQVEVAVEAKTGGPFTSRNVLAEIPGRERPEEVVLMGAHLDAWDLGTGAEDNGVNVAMVIDVARGMMELGLVPRRTVRFALFTGEESGLWGSAGYVQTHAAELSDHILMMDHDTGSGRIRGFLLGGREELRTPMERALEAVSGFGPFTLTNAAINGTDHFDFLLSGVPNVVADQVAGPYLPDYHASSDTLDKVDLREARVNVAIASAVMWHFAESTDVRIPRQSRAQVQKLLEEQGLIQVMKAFGQHQAWTEGRRGVHDR